jgi:intracellular sulfur oxidation DsrE/DsrF family protein
MPRRWYPLLTMILLLGLAPPLRAEPARIVYHLHQVTPVTLKRALNNIENLYKGLEGERPQIHLLLQGESLMLLSPRKLTPAFRQRLTALLRKGLVLEAGAANYLEHREQLDPAFPTRLNRNIISRLVALQRQGYQYVTP